MIRVPIEGAYKLAEHDDVRCATGGDEVFVNRSLLVCSLPFLALFIFTS